MARTPVTQPEEADIESESDEGRSQHRSPNYPFIPLEKAVERAKTLYNAEARHTVRFEVVAKHWGYAAKSSGAKQTVGALRYFGLISLETQGASRAIKLTDRALRILLDKREGERLKALQEAALSPKLYADLWAAWGKAPPSDDTAISHLTFELAFNPTTAPAALAAYKETIAFAGLTSSAKVSEAAEGKTATDEQEHYDMEETANEPTQSGQKQRVPVQHSPMMRGETESFRLPLGGRVVRVLVQGEPPTQAVIKKLIANLELNLDQFPPDTVIKSE
jgi:hypothetical protein